MSQSVSQLKEIAAGTVDMITGAPAFMAGSRTFGFVTGIIDNGAGDCTLVLDSDIPVIVTGANLMVALVPFAATVRVWAIEILTTLQFRVRIATDAGALTDTSFSVAFFYNFS